MTTLTMQNSKTIPIWSWLTKPHASIADIEERRQSKLLAMLSIALMAGGILGELSTIANIVRLGYPAYQALVILPVPLGTLLAFYLNRRGHYNSAAYTLIVI